MSDHAKESGTKKVWGVVVATVGITLGLIVLFTLGGSLISTSVDSFGSASEGVGASVVHAANSAGDALSQGLRAVSRMISKFLMAGINALIFPVIVFLIGRMIYNEIKKGKGATHLPAADAHPPPAAGAHPPAGGH